MAPDPVEWDRERVHIWIVVGCSKVNRAVGSYTPVREALRRLESEGLVVTDVHRGASVSQAESDELGRELPDSWRPWSRWPAVSR